MTRAEAAVAQRHRGGAPRRELHSHTVVLGGQRVRYAFGGSSRARRVLLLFNGIGTHIETMAPFIERFRHTRVLAFDVPGVGLSPAPWLPYRLADVARLAERLLDHLGVEQADVLGVSWGGAAAQEFALRHPQRCRTLTLAAAYAGLVMVHGPYRLLLHALDPRRYLAPGIELEWLRDYALATLGPGLRGAVYQLLAMWGWTGWLRLHRLHAPTLVLVGDDDPIVPPANGRIAASRLPSATLETVPCGHLFVLTRPGETAQRVERFLEDHPLRAA